MAKGASPNYAWSCFLVAMINMINAASANGGSCVLPRNATDVVHTEFLNYEEFQSA